MFNFEKLEIYSEAKKFVEIIFRTFKNIKVDREIENQIKRAAISIVLNIAEGSVKGSKKQFNQYLWISQGSIGEVIAGFDLITTLYPEKIFESHLIRQNAEILAKRINKLIYR